MVGHELVALDELFAVNVEPVGKPLMQSGAVGLGQHLVRGVADQQVAEAVALLAGDLGAVRPDQLPTDQRAEPGPWISLRRGEGRDSAAVEDLALDGGRFQYPALGRIELIETSREQRLQRRRHRHLGASGLDHRDHLLDEQGVAARGPQDALAQLRR